MRRFRSGDPSKRRPRLTARRCPLPPGVDQGAVAVVRKRHPETKVAVELPLKKGAIVVKTPEDIERPIQILVAPPPIELPRRYYFVIGVSPRGRMAAPSTPTSIPLEPASAAPGAPQVTYTESDMTIKWEPPAGARTATVEPPPPVVPKPLVPPAAGATTVAAPPTGATAVAGGANASPGNATPAVPVLAPLVAKSLGFNSVATTYNVYEVPTTAEPDALPGASPELKVPAALTPPPLTATTMVLKGVGFGTERCFYVRPIDTVFGVVVQGPASPITCVTPRDTFPPAAPKQLAAIGSAGVINLIWEPNIEADLGGYIVLRGEAPGDKLQPLTKEPITATIYRDTDLKPGVRYVYAVVAVDKAEPPNVSVQSNRAEETARQ